MKSSRLKAETKVLIIAAKYQSLASRYYLFHKDGTNPKWRICGQYDETVKYIISGCLKLARKEYIHRLNRVATYLFWKIFKEHTIYTTELWYEHQPHTFISNIYTFISVIRRLVQYIRIKHIFRCVVALIAFIPFIK